MKRVDRLLLLGCLIAAACGGRSTKSSASGRSVAEGGRSVATGGSTGGGGAGAAPSGGSSLGGAGGDQTGGTITGGGGSTTGGTTTGGDGAGGSSVDPDCSVIADSLPAGFTTRYALTDIWGSRPADIWVTAAPRPIPCTIECDPQPELDSVALHYDGSSWTSVTIAPEPNLGLVSVSGTSSDDVWFSSTTALFHFDGSGFMAYAGAGGRIWTGQAGVVFAVHANGVGRFDGAEWTEWQLRARQPTGLWGRRTDEVYVAGPDGVFAFDGDGWSLAHDASRLSDGPFATWPVWVTGSGERDLYVSHYGGDVLHFDGARWERILLPPDTALVGDLWADGPGDLWVATSFNFGVPNVLHHDGTAWAQYLVHDSPVAIYDDGAVLFVAADSGIYRITCEGN